MLAEAAVYAVIFVLARLEPGLALTLAALALLVHTQHEAKVTDLKKALVKQETTSAELRQQNSKLEAQNRTWTEESEKYRSNALFMQESFQTLSQDLSHAMGRVGQHQTTITELRGRVVDRDKQIASLSQTCEEASSNVIILRRELEQKTKEAADWRDLYTVHRSPNVSRLYQERRRQETSQSNTPGSELSLATIIEGKDQEIARLIDRVSECHSQLALCQCSGLNSRLQRGLEIQRGPDDRQAGRYSANREMPIAWSQPCIVTEYMDGLAKMNDVPRSTPFHLRSTGSQVEEDDCRIFVQRRFKAHVPP